MMRLRSSTAKQLSHPLRKCANRLRRIELLLRSTSQLVIINIVSEFSILAFAFHVTEAHSARRRVENG